VYPITGDRDEEEFRRDERVILAARLMDPARRLPDSVPSLSAAELILRAEQRVDRRDPARLRTPPQSILTGLVVTSIAVVVAAIVLVPSMLAKVHEHSSVEGTSSVPVALYSGNGTNRPAGPDLRLMAQAAAGRPDGPAGPVTYTRLATWSLDVTATPATGAARDEQLWWTADRAGRIVVTDSGASPATTTFGRGELAVVVEQPSTDPALLAAQLDEHEPFSDGPQAALRAVRDLYRYHALTGAGRSAALRVLAETPDMMFRGSVTLENGKTGVVISADSERGAVRDLAVFDPTDGRLLAYQQVSTRGTGGVASAPRVTYQMLVLANGTTDAIGSTVVRTR
jgi:hypothetical protein